MKVILLVRSDLKMSTGKIVSQTGHALVEMLKNASKKKIRKWRRESEKIVTLKVKDKEELEFILQNAKEDDLYSNRIYDMGLTQVEDGTLTVGLIGPESDFKINSITQGLKLF